MTTSPSETTTVVVWQNRREGGWAEFAGGGCDHPAGQDLIALSEILSNMRNMMYTRANTSQIAKRLPWEPGS